MCRHTRRWQVDDDVSFALVFKVFKVLYKHVESFHKKSRFFSGYNKFWVVQNSSPIIHHLNRINAKKKAKRISTFDFSTLYTTIPHDLLIEVLSKIISFVFDSSCRNKLGFSKKSVYWTSKGKDNRVFTRDSLIECVSFLIQNCFFKVGNQILKQDIGIPMGIDPAPFWANLFLYYFESNFVKSLVSRGSVKAYNFNAVGRFIDDLYALNDTGKFALCNKIYIPKNLNWNLNTKVHMPLSLIWIFLLWMVFLCTSYLIKETRFHFLLCVCHTSKVTYHLQSFMVRSFRKYYVLLDAPFGTTISSLVFLNCVGECLNKVPQKSFCRNR